MDIWQNMWTRWKAAREGMRCFLGLLRKLPTIRQISLWRLYPKLMSKTISERSIMKQEVCHRIMSSGLVTCSCNAKPVNLQQDVFGCLSQTVSVVDVLKINKCRQTILILTVFPFYILYRRRRQEWSVPVQCPQKFCLF